jgi:hypothetical protein
MTREDGENRGERGETRRSKEKPNCTTQYGKVADIVSSVNPRNVNKGTRIARNRMLVVGIGISDMQTKKSNHVMDPRTTEKKHCAEITVPSSRLSPRR